MNENLSYEQDSNNGDAYVPHALEKWRNQEKPVFQELTTSLRVRLLQLNRSHDRLINIRAMYDEPPFNGSHRWKLSILKGYVDLVRHALELSTIPSLVTFRSANLHDAVELDEEATIPEEEFDYDWHHVLAEWLDLAEDELNAMQSALRLGIEELSLSLSTLHRIDRDLQKLPATQENDQVLHLIIARMSLYPLVHDLQQRLNDVEALGSFISQMQQV